MRQPPWQGCDHAIRGYWGSYLFEDVIGFFFSLCFLAYPTKKPKIVRTWSALMSMSSMQSDGRGWRRRIGDYRKMRPLRRSWRRWRKGWRGDDDTDALLLWEATGLWLIAEGLFVILITLYFFFLTLLELFFLGIDYGSILLL